MEVTRSDCVIIRFVFLFVALGSFRHPVRQISQIHCCRGAFDLSDTTKVDSLLTLCLIEAFSLAALPSVDIELSLLVTRD